jgi:hypothetical protein
MKNYPALDLEEENFSFKPTAILSGEKDTSGRFSDDSK